MVVENDIGEPFFNDDPIDDVDDVDESESILRFKRTVKTVPQTKTKLAELATK